VSNVLPFSTPRGAPEAPTPAAILPYPVTPGFERAMVTALCLRPRLWAVLHGEIEAKAIASEIARRALAAASEIARDTGRGPQGLLVVIQRLRKQVDAGKITIDHVAEVSDYFDDAIDAGIPDDAAIIAEIKPILIERAGKAAINEGMRAQLARGDVTKPFERVTRLQRLGEVVDQPGVYFGKHSLDLIESTRHLVRLQTGIFELDQALKGGVRRGTGNMFLGPESSGKSVGLIQIGVAGVLQGIPTAYLTMELPEETIHARMLANLTGIPIDSIMDDPFGCGVDEALDRIAGIVQLGPLVICELPARATPRDVFAAIDREEQRLGCKIELVDLDYADKCTPGADPTLGKNAGLYEQMGSVYDQFFQWARDTDRWFWTASQSTRGDGNPDAVLGLDDVADSKGKTRNFDTVITLNPRDNFEQMIYGMAKNRHGRRGAIVGPLPCDFECGRIAPVNYP